jgi:hypothetical protein
LSQGAPVSEFVEALDPETRKSLFYGIAMAWSESTPASTHSPEIAEAARRLGWLAGERYRGGRREYLRACLRGEQGGHVVIFGSQASRFTVPTIGTLLTRVHPGSVLVNEGPCAVDCEMTAHGPEPAVMVVGGDAAEVPCGARSEDGSLTCGLMGAHRGMHLDVTTNTGWVAP